MVRRFSSHKIRGSESIAIVKLDKSGGCVDRGDTFMQRSREIAIREYFFGDLKNTLSPHTQQVNFDDITIYKIQEGMLDHFLSFKNSF